MTTKDSQMCLYKTNGSSSTLTVQSDDAKSSQIIKSYKRRFWMLFIFSTLSMLSGMLFTQYLSMADVNICFYEVGVEAVNWTGLVFLVVYLVLVFPVSWLMGKTGLRKTVIIGSVFNTISVAVQFATLTSDSFPYVMVAQFFASLSNVFVLAIPPSLAAIWYPSKEISRACAMGVFGNQLGVALGFVFSSLLVSGGCSNKDLVAEGKRNVAIILTSVNVVMFFLILFTFQNEPKHPPSIAQADKKDIQESYLRSALSMAKNVQFVLVFIVYGTVCGTYFAIATILNNLILRYYPNADVAIGWMGLLVIVAGLVGSIIAGYILDYTHKFKETTISICLLSFIAYVIFSCLLSMNRIWIQFVTLGILGYLELSLLKSLPTYCSMEVPTMLTQFCVRPCWRVQLFHNADVAIGWMGLLVIVAGLVGSIIAGYILDYTHKFKETTISICLLSFIAYVIFSCLLSMNRIWIQFVTLGVLGFFLTSFLPVGFEYGIEVTYPESEITSAGLLNSSTMIFGIIITEISSNVLQHGGPNYANAVLCAALLASSVISCFITKNYRRSIKNNEITSTNL